MATLSIGKLAKAADVKVPTIRFYEQIGLLPRPPRTESDRRLYDEVSVGRLAFIKRARQLGFPIDAVRTLLDLSDHPDRACEDAIILAQEQLAAVESKIVQLESLRSALGRMVASRCEGGPGRCRVIEALAEHAPFTGCASVGGNVVAPE
ncbi:MerR family transcriptional regulator [Phenylobacterium aquaticum]|uniref:MerR family transcriptional regulator n=1 Tax=Phenylobacterium aquaticum TaxID=1763816 RepID=UPI001F5D543C|nr:helix-turn-helix domain-containing protein [Phenylobacterium aquaticum]MCI3130781.1 helix-turn-helix domain-containing protein [Phenylobacterium aquaticum]